MSRISGNVVGFFHQTITRLGEDPVRFFEGTRIDPFAPTAADISWDTFCTLNHRLEAVVGGPEALEHLGAAVMEARELSGFFRILRLVASPDKIYWASMKWSAPSGFPSLTNTYEALSDKRLRLSITIPAHLQDCPQFLRICAGFFRALPRVIGLPDAHVTWELFPRHGVYTVDPPSSMTVFVRVKHAALALFSARSAFEELAAQQASLQRRFEELVQAHAELIEARQGADQAREALERAVQTKSEFLASISHELRTPMNGVIGMADVLGGTSLDRQQKQYLGEIQKAAHSMLSLVDDLLDFTRVESRQLALERVHFDLHYVIADVVEHHARIAHARRLSLVCEVDEDLPRVVVGDPGRFRQILTCLLSNATKFTEQGGVDVEVTSILDEDARSVRLSVAVHDTGRGIPSDMESMLFQPFLQADRGMARRFGGAGLGLALSKRLVELMGGTIAYERRRDGGSTFRFTIPLGVAEQPIAVAVGPAPSSIVPRPIDTSARARRESARASQRVERSRAVLVVENNPVSRERAAMIFRRVGLPFEVVSSGDEAIRQAASNAYAAVFIDCDMPGRDGYETARALRESLVVKPVLIAMTTTADLVDEARLREVGFDDHVLKPLRPGAMTGLIRRWLPASDAPVARLG